MADPTPPKDLTGLHDLPPIGFDPIGMPIMPEIPADVPDVDPPNLDESIVSTEVSSDFLPFKDSAEPQGLSDFDNPLPADGEPSPEPELPSHILSRLVRYAHKDDGLSRDPLMLTLRIRGQVGLIERDRLLRLLSEHELGMSAQDLDVQIKSGRMLIPRINEYAATRIFQELRDSSLEFTIEDVAGDDREGDPKGIARFTHTRTQTEAPKSNFEDVRICGRADLSESEEVFDLIEIPHMIRTQTVMAEKSDQYGALLGRVTLELKARARLKGAHAIVDFQTSLDTLKDPAHYMLTVRGYLVRFRGQ